MQRCCQRALVVGRRAVRLFPGQKRNVSKEEEWWQKTVGGKKRLTAAMVIDGLECRDGEEQDRLACGHERHEVGKRCAKSVEEKAL